MKVFKPIKTTIFLITTAFPFTALADHHAKDKTENPIEVEEQQAKAEKTAELIIFRKKFSPPLAYKPMMIINGKQAFYLPRGYHAKLKLPPGEYSITSDWKPLHGPTDKTIDISLIAGQSTWLRVGSSIALLSDGTNINTDFTSSVSEQKEADLSKSRQISRWAPGWKQSETGVYGDPRHHKYNVQIDSGKVLQDINNSDKVEQTAIFRYLANNKFYEEAILLQAEETLLQNYQTDFENEDDEQWTAYISKYIASSRMPEYKDTIITAWQGAQNKRLKRYLKSYLKSYYGFDVKKEFPKEKKKDK